MGEVEKKIKDSYIYDSSPILRKSIRRKNYIIISLIMILIFMVGLNSYFAMEYKDRANYISSYHHYVVEEFSASITNANHEMSFAVENVSNQGELLNNLISTKLYLETASSYINGFTIFYKFESDEDTSNILSDPFFLSYIQALQDWIDALASDDVINSPSIGEIELMAEDINNLTEKFLVYDNETSGSLINIEELNAYELNTLLIQLANETKSLVVKEYLEKVF